MSRPVIWMDRGSHPSGSERIVRTDFLELQTFQTKIALRLYRVELPILGDTACPVCTVHIDCRCLPMHAAVQLLCLHLWEPLSQSDISFRVCIAHTGFLASMKSPAILLPPACPLTKSVSRVHIEQTRFLHLQHNATTLRPGSDPQVHDAHLCITFLTGTPLYCSPHPKVSSEHRQLHLFLLRKHHRQAKSFSLSDNLAPDHILSALIHRKSPFAVLAEMQGYLVR